MNKEKYLYEWLIDLINTENIIFKYEILKIMDIDFDIDVEFCIENLEIKLSYDEKKITITKKEENLFSDFKNKYDLELNYNFNDSELFKKLVETVREKHIVFEKDKNQDNLDIFIEKITEKNLESEWEKIKEMNIRSNIAKELMNLKTDDNNNFFDNDYLLKNVLKLSDKEIEENLLFKQNKDIDYSLIKIDKKYIDYMNKLDYLEYVDVSRIDGNPIYKINIPILEVIKKI